MSQSTLDELFRILESRKDADPAVSYTAKLLGDRKKIAKKLGEEGVEAALEVLIGDRDKLVSESADVLYHLLVSWVALGIQPEEVWRSLEARMGRSGLEEKKSRKAE
ncbi:phosphoribosyl-ATP diphosphatase [Oceanibaculum nanhaiense]|uniref:phosphoribosyl-ATP diphosphatase n=1 Tax=Oceanibaculum nanhaiense TaxID=1909734 RepID=UPI003D2D5C8E